MIIVEGVDNTGKTTLIQKLKERFPSLELVPKWVGPRGPESSATMWNHMMLYLRKYPEKTLNLVFDRFPLISEQVYGPIIRGCLAFTKEEIALATQLFRVHDPLVIHCHRSLRSILADFDEREQMEGVKENLKALLEQYVHVLDKLGCLVVAYNFELPGEWEKIEAVVSAYLEED